MCYSEEVQATTGITIWVFSLVYYIFYSIKYKAIHREWLLPFLKNILIAFALIGGHQVFEALSLITENQIIYKTGLILSISSMYFFIRSLEVILNRNLRSRLALIVIGAVAIHAFLVNMSFEATSFHLRHNSAFIWASAWMFLFIYFHICALKGRKLLKKDRPKKMMVLYLFATLDISFILSFLYTIWGYHRHSMNVCTNSPSIWCTFFVVQVIVLPIFLSLVPKTIKQPKTKILRRPKKRSVQSVRETAWFILLSLVVLTLLVSTLPFFECLSLKFVFP